ncbi:MAG TPA: UDP-N-acetylglucosamine 2-epimerase (non-hydrolyzing) [Anaerolineaceae bacterium]|nr:UDP-N-acetylglucosamine 2-epimerase (non-hydrolyzing) [Anaerolineaceae bacterium]
MKIVTVVGARPQFIKAAVLSREIRKDHTEVLVHTGQHYDQNMSDIFFEELGIPAPDYNLGIGSGPHGKQTGEMLAGIEEVLLQERPDWVLVYGDTNSTLAGALAAVKLHIRVAHVEAGLRSFNRRMPEETNRVLTDHASDLLLCPTQTAVDNLEKEGVTAGVHLVGDVMYEALMWAAAQHNAPSILDTLGLEPGKYLLVTVHRAENTDDPERLGGILAAFDQVQETLVWPVHPRTRLKLQELNWKPTGHVKLIEPLGYLDMAQLQKHARIILTDSGGIQKEACWLGVPCITLRDETEWVETVKSGWNRLAGTKTEDILKAISTCSAEEKNELLPQIPFDGKTVIQLLGSENL